VSGPKESKEHGCGRQAKAVRPPAAAGRFYPADPAELRELIRAMLAEAPVSTGPSPKAIIAPHAGYPYSGPIAASAYAQLVPARKAIRRIVLLGPSHRVAFEGLAMPSATAFATPLGSVPLDTEALHQIETLPQVTASDKAHAFEHSLETQLPFLQVVLGDFKLVPLVVGDASPEEVSEVIDTLWGGPETRFVISSDLSHYHDFLAARSLDQATAEAIQGINPDQISEGQACGRLAIQGLLLAAHRRGMRARTLDLRNSGDTAGPRDQVVGYGAFAFDEQGS